MEYRLTIRREIVGPLYFELRCLRDFDEAIDMTYAVLQAAGEGDRLVELCPFFGKLWPSARALAAALAALGVEGLSGRSVLEAGCGLALPSLVAARLGACVTASDVHPDVERFLADNLARNGVDGVRYVTADWREAAGGGALGDQRFDLVVGSDVLYDREHVEALAALVERRTAPGGRALVTDPGRAYLQEFVTRAERLGFAATLGTAAVAGDDGAAKDVFIVELRRVEDAQTDAAPRSRMPARASF